MQYIRGGGGGGGGKIGKPKMTKNVTTQEIKTKNRKLYDFHMG